MLKKILIGATLGTMLFSTSAFAADINVNVNGEAVVFANQKPVIVEGRTLIPLRGVFEKLGYEVSWDGETKTATLSNDVNTVVVKTGVAEIKFNDTTVVADVPAQIINGSMMIPLRAIGEGTGELVNWDPATKTADIDVLTGLTEEEAYSLRLEYAIKPLNEVLVDMEKELNMNIGDVDVSGNTSVEELIADVQAQMDEEKAKKFMSSVEKYKVAFSTTRANVEKITPPAEYKEFHDLTIEYLKTYEGLLVTYGDFVMGKATEEELVQKIEEARNVLTEYFAAVVNMSQNME